MGETFRRFSHSIHKMLKVNKPSHPPQTGGRDQTSTNNNENVLNVSYFLGGIIHTFWASYLIKLLYIFFQDDLAAFPDLLRDRQILTSNSLSDFRRTVILKREPTQSFGFSLQSVSIAKADDDRTGKFTYVSKVEIDSPADNAGILKGSFILQGAHKHFVFFCRWRHHRCRWRSSRGLLSRWFDFINPNQNSNAYDCHLWKHGAEGRLDI